MAGEVARETGAPRRGTSAEEARRLGCLSDAPAGPSVAPRDPTPGPPCPAGLRRRLDAVDDVRGGADLAGEEAPTSRSTMRSPGGGKETAPRHWLKSAEENRKLYSLARCPALPDRSPIAAKASGCLHEKNGSKQ